MARIPYFHPCAPFGAGSRVGLSGLFYLCSLASFAADSRAYFPCWRWSRQSPSNILVTFRINFRYGTNLRAARRGCRLLPAAPRGSLFPPACGYPVLLCSLPRTHRQHAAVNHRRLLASPSCLKAALSHATSPHRRTRAREHHSGAFELVTAASLRRSPTSALPRPRRRRTIDAHMFRETATSDPTPAPFVND